MSKQGRSYLFTEILTQKNQQQISGLIRERTTSVLKKPRTQVNIKKKENEINEMKNDSPIDYCSLEEEITFIHSFSLSLSLFLIPGLSIFFSH